MAPRIGYFLYDSKALDHSGVIDRLGQNSAATHLSGGNLGNFAFKYGLRRMVGSHVGFFDSRTPPEQVRSEFDILLVAEANVVNPAIDFGPLADRFEEYDLPVVVCGIGSQASISVESADQFPALNSGTARYLRVLAQRSPSLIVRGSFTAAVLQSQLGIENVKVGGCPSYFINPKKDLWARVCQKASRNSLALRPALTEGYYHPAWMPENGLELERKLFSLVREGSTSYILQQNFDLLNLVCGLEMPSTAALEKSRAYSSPDMSIDDYITLIRKNCKGFLRADEWVAYLRNRSSTFGTRIHGNILSLQAETPALVVAHDRRTIELADTLKIPRVGVEEILQLKSPGSIFEKIADIYASLDAQGLDENRRQLAFTYRQVFQELDIPVSENLGELAF